MYELSDILYLPPLVEDVGVSREYFSTELSLEFEEFSSALTAPARNIIAINTNERFMVSSKRDQSVDVTGIGQSKFKKGFYARHRETSSRYRHRRLSSG
jgi:hypothetical protein